MEEIIKIKNKNTNDTIYECEIPFFMKNVSERNKLRYVVIKALSEKISLQYAHLEGADFSYLDLSFADFREANLRYANLEGCNLTHTNFYNADMEDVNFRSANIDQAFIRQRYLTKKNTLGANVKKAFLYKIRPSWFFGG